MERILFHDAECLAPMVRCGTLPMRLLALSYGCDTVWGEELVDRRVMATTRAVNKELGTVEWRSNSNGAIAFQTCALEKDKVVFQLGTSNDVNAVKAASQVAGDVAAIDVNMGCPKHFSISGGMGAALLSTPDIAMGIIKALKRNVQIPVTAKIRALDSIDKTVEFCRRLESAGVSAISLHCRQRSTSPKHPADWSILGHAVSAVQVPIIANGDIYTREDMVKVKEVSSCSSVMLARPALLNCSVFDKSGKLQPRHRVICDYLKLCLRYEHHFKGTKYTVGEMVAPGRHPGEFLQKRGVSLRDNDLPLIYDVHRSKTFQDLASVFGLELGGVSLARAGPIVENRPTMLRFDDDYFASEAAKELSERKGERVASPAPKRIRSDTSSTSGCDVQ